MTKVGVFAIVCTVLVVIHCAQGLSCYNCVYLETELPDGFHLSLPSDESCQDGQTPHLEYLVDCSEIQYGADSDDILGAGFINAFSAFKKGQHAFFMFGSNQKKSPDLYTYSCANFTFAGRFHMNPITDDFRATIRTCLRSQRETPFTEECHVGKLGKLVTKASDMEVTEALSSYAFFLNTKETELGMCISNQPGSNFGSAYYPSSKVGDSGSAVATILNFSLIFCSMFVYLLGNGVKLADIES